MPRLGQAHDPETRRRVSEMMTGRKLSKSHRKNISKGRRKSFLENEKDNDYHLPKSRTCKVCGKRKASDEFRKESRKLKSGLVRVYLRSTCKLCENKASQKTSRAWRKRKQESGELADLYRRYEANRSDESKEYQRQLNRENDAIRRRDRGSKPRKNHKPIEEEIKVDRMPLVRVIEAALKDDPDLTIEQISQRGQLNRHTAITYILQGWEPTKKNKTGKTSLKWITLHRVDQILRGLDREEELTILYNDEVIDAGLKAQAKEAAQKAARSKAKRRKKARERYAQKRGQAG